MAACALLPQIRTLPVNSNGCVSFVFRWREAPVTAQSHLRTDRHLASPFHHLHRLLCASQCRVHFWIIAHLGVIGIVLIFWGWIVANHEPNASRAAENRATTAVKPCGRSHEKKTTHVSHGNPTPCTNQSTTRAAVSQRVMPLRPPTTRSRAVGSRSDPSRLPLVRVAQYNENIPQRPRPVTPPKGRFVFNFQNAPWSVVIRRYAETFGLSLRIEKAPDGSFTHVDERSYSPAEAIDVLNGELLRRNYLLIRSDASLRLLELNKGVPTHLVPRVELSDLDHLGRFEVCSVVLSVQRLNGSQVCRDIQGLLSPFGAATCLSYTNNIMVTDVVANLRRIRDFLLAGDAPSIYPPSMIFKLKNAPAEQVVAAFREFVASRNGAEEDEGMSPNQVTVVAEPSTNSVMVSGPSFYLDTLTQMIEELDDAPQVIIQALLVEVELDNLDEFGVELGAQNSVLFDRSVLGNLVTLTETVADPGTGILTTNQRVLSQEASPGFAFNNAPPGNNVAVRPGTVGAQSLSNFGVGRVNGELGFGGLVLSAGSESISVLLRALAAKRQVDILSRPQIRTLENHQAEIQIGSQVPVVDGVAISAVGSANPVIRQDQAGIILRVLPRVKPNGTVVMDVVAERSSFQTGPGSGVPIFTDVTTGIVIEAPVKNLTQAQATVSVFNGETIVLGGMITKDNIIVERKVPWLGDVPFLGRAFRHDVEQVKRRELLIFLTPRIILNTAESGRIMEEEINRTKFPHANAQQMHGPFAPGVINEPLGQPPTPAGELPYEYRNPQAVPIHPNKAPSAPNLPSSNGMPEQIPLPPPVEVQIDPPEMNHSARNNFNRRTDNPPPTATGNSRLRIINSNRSSLSHRTPTLKNHIDSDRSLDAKRRHQLEQSQISRLPPVQQSVPR